MVIPIIPSPDQIAYAILTWYRAGFSRQVKNRVLTLTKRKEYEKVKVYRSPDPEGS